MMCKPKDDLRKDARLMEFNSIVNKCLRKDPECRRRNLHIRTYVRLPFSVPLPKTSVAKNEQGAPFTFQPLDPIFL